VTKICLVCEQKFECNQVKQKFCSQKCMGKYYSLHPHSPKKKKIRLICKVCGKEFWILPSALKWVNRETCSRKCQGLLRRKRVIRVCESCGKEFEVRNCETMRSHRSRFCSLKCRYGFMVGKNAPVPLDHIKLICETCGKEFEINRYKEKNARFCSQRCMLIWRSKEWEGGNNPNFRNAKGKFICKYCGEEFIGWERNRNRTRFCSRRCLGAWTVLHMKRRLTSLEKIVQKILRDLNLKFEIQKRIKPFIVDFFLKPNLIIEADGSYWHKDKVKDKKRDVELESKGYRVLHLAENLIKQDIQVCRHHIIVFTKDLTMLK